MNSTSTNPPADLTNFIPPSADSFRYTTQADKIFEMKRYYIAILIIFSLLSQQALAGVISASMLGHMQSMPSQMPEMEMGMDEHKVMLSHDDSSHNMDGISHSSNSDCCDADCQCGFVCSFSFVIDIPSAHPLPTSSQAAGRYSSGLLAQSLDILFRPPIFA